MPRQGHDTDGRAGFLVERGEHSLRDSCQSRSSGTYSRRLLIWFRSEASGGRACITDDGGVDSQYQSLPFHCAPSLLVPLAMSTLPWGATPVALLESPPLTAVCLGSAQPMAGSLWTMHALSHHPSTQWDCEYRRYVKEQRLHGFD